MTTAEAPVTVSESVNRFEMSSARICASAAVDRPKTVTVRTSAAESL